MSVEQKIQNALKVEDFDDGFTNVHKAYNIQRKA
jgi:hypothetical protein